MGRSKESTVRIRLFPLLILAILSVVVRPGVAQQPAAGAQPTVGQQPTPPAGGQPPAGAQGRGAANPRGNPADTEIWDPVPKVVTPGATIGAPPSDAIVLFDGSNLDQWV